MHFATADGEPAFFAVYGHAAVVAHFLFGSGHAVKERCLAAIRITDKGNAQHIVCHRVNARHLGFDNATKGVFHVTEFSIFVGHLDLCGFAVPQRDV